MSNDNVTTALTSFGQIFSTSQIPVRASTYQQLTTVFLTFQYLQQNNDILR